MKTKKVQPIIWISAALLGFMALSKWRPGWLGRAFAKQQSKYYRDLIPQYKWRVKLKTGETVTLTNKQLADEIDRGNAQSWKQLTSAVTIPAGKSWVVTLRDGRVVTMNSIQLQQAVNANAVKNYRVAAASV